METTKSITSEKIRNTILRHIQESGPCSITSIMQYVKLHLGTLPKKTIIRALGTLELRRLIKEVEGIYYSK